MKRVRCSVILGVLLSLPPALAEAQDVIDFEGLPEGTVVFEVYSRGGAGPIKVEASNEKFPPGQNAAIIFDSSCPPDGVPSDCSGEDQDLGTPNEAYGGPGQGNQGSGGDFANDVALGNILIVAEDLASSDGGKTIDDPDDEGSTHVNQITIDFSEIGPITMHSIAVVDINFGAEQSTIDLLDADGAPLGDSPYLLPRTENNGVVDDYDLGSTPNVSKMIIWLRGSGAIDNITFSPQIDIETKTNGFQADLVEDDDIPWIRIGEPVAWTYEVTNTSGMRLTDVEVTDSRGVEVSCPRDTLEPGETMECSAGGSSFDLTLSDLPFPIVQGQCRGRGGRPLYENTGTVTAMAGGRVVSDSDPSHYCADPPTTSIYVRKQRKGPDTRGLASGADASFQIVVWNNGNNDLTDIQVVDALAPDCDRQFSRLGAGRSTSYSCTVSGLTIGGANVDGCSFVNEVVATGQSGGQTVTDSDTSTIELMGLAISKSFQSTDTGVATFDIQVTNNGCDLDSVIVTDEVAPDCERDIGALPAGESRSYSCSMLLENTACVEGTRGDGSVDACDTATFTVESAEATGEAESGDSEGDAAETADAADAGEEGGDTAAADADGSGAPSGALLALLAVLVAGGLFAWNRMKAG